jgi:hypothetical protein
MEEGKALSETNADEKLLGSWEIRTTAFIRAAYGEDEAMRYSCAIEP